MKNLNKHELPDMYKIENELVDQGYNYICGVDEVGRGPIAGPVTVCAIILPNSFRLKGVNDSKQLSDKKRRELFKILKKEALAISVVSKSCTFVDKHNIYEATRIAMYEAINKLSIKPNYVLIDAMKMPDLEIKHDSIIHGDAKSASIAAASIIAKVTRDDYMEKMDVKYPNYGFAKHKGYCTKAHVEALAKYGPCKIHRKTFAPVNKYFSNQLKFDFDKEE